MPKVTILRFLPTARVPFCNRLAREFERSRTHIRRMCLGEVASPLREHVLARQAELLRLNARPVKQRRRQDRTPARHQLAVRTRALVVG